MNTKKPVGNGITAPVMGEDNLPHIQATGDMSGSHDINGTASQENLSAKYKYPNVKQEVPEAGRNQYQDQ